MDNEEKKITKVSFKKGIHVHGENEDVDVSLKGIHIETDKESVHMDKKEMRTYAAQEMKEHKGRIFISLGLIAIAVAVYIFLGKHFGVQGWSYGWLVFLAALVTDSLISAIEKKKPSEFAYVLLAVIIFLLFGFFKHLWHPAWVIFLTIPVYYIICDKIQNRKKDK